MNVVARFCLAFSILFFTPVGVYVCGSLTPALFLSETSYGLELLDDGTIVFHDVDTAVSNYLSTPFFIIPATITLVLVYYFPFLDRILPTNQIEKRKPPTPPPCFSSFAPAYLP